MNESDTTNRLRRIATNHAVIHAAAFLVVFLVTKAVGAFRVQPVYGVGSLVYDSTIIQSAPAQLEDPLSILVITAIVYGTGALAARLATR